MSGVVAVSKLLQIDRSKPFDPVAFIGNGSVSKYGDNFSTGFFGTGWLIVEQDNRSLALNEVDLDKVIFETMLCAGETRVRHEEWLERLVTSGHIRLDAKIFETLWNN